MTTTNKLGYGTYHVQDADQYPAAWGARLIFNEVMGGMTGLVWDRQDAIGGDEEKKTLLGLLNGGVMDKALAEARKLGMYPGDDARFVLYDDVDVQVIGSPQGSYGYLYVTALLR